MQYRPLATMALLHAFLFTLMLLPAHAQDVDAVSNPKPVVLSKQALEIHQPGYIWDGHNDLPWAIRNHAGSSFERMGIGVDHVGLGSDYDGVSALPEQLEDVSTYPYITQVMLDRGYRANDIQKILSGNMMRVME